MVNLFLYGTLRHLPLLEIVLGHLPEARLKAASLEGYRVSWALGQSFPLIEADAGSQAEGLLLCDVTQAERARLDHYELGFGYKLHEVSVAGAPAMVYLPEVGLWTADGPWSLAAWVQSHWPYVAFSASEIMELMGQVPTGQLSHSFSMLQARAAARARAQAQEVPTELRNAVSRSDVDVVDQHLRHLGFFRTDEFHLRHPKYNGAQSELLSREVFYGGDAALVLPYDAKHDRVLLVEQFRMGPFARGDNHPWVLEPIAGRIDAGEAPEQAARRECKEEAGLELKDLLPVANYYPSPGEVTTYFYTYLGLADLPDANSGLGGLDSEAEDLRWHVVPFEAAMKLVQSGEINVGPLLHLLLWLDGKRTALQTV